MQDQKGQCQIEGGDAKEPFLGKDAKESIDFEISLAPLDSTDMGIIRMWRNDYKIWKWCRQNDLISDYEQKVWFEKQAKDPTIKMYKLILSFLNEKKEQQMIHFGVCGFTSIDLINRHAEFSLYVAPAYQGLKLSECALRCLLEHGFKNLGFHVIWGEVFEDNPAMRVFEKVGFKYDGTRRDFYFRDGKFISSELISIVEDEWKQ